MNRFVRFNELVLSYQDAHDYLNQNINQVQNPVTRTRAGEKRQLPGNTLREADSLSTIFFIRRGTVNGGS